MQQLRATILLIAPLLCLACASSVAPNELQLAIDALRDGTRPFHSHAQAMASGYNVKITDCMSDPQGGMGFHYGNGALIDARPEALKPEVVMYAPKPNGELELVGIEYVVPFDQWTAATPPSLHGQQFQRNEQFKVWALHMWIWKENPNGLFASWNPAVSCASASASADNHSEVRHAAIRH